MGQRSGLVGCGVDPAKETAASLARLMVGSDVIADLPNWHEPQQVLALAPLFALGRLGHPVPGTPPAVLPEISSSEARARLAGSEGDQAWLDQYIPQSVLNYIAEQRLYRES